MKRPVFHGTRLALLAALLAAGTPLAVAQPTSASREFRGVWLTTVFGLDWPSSGDSEATQRTKLNQLLDKAESLNMTSVIFQVRGECDAMYQSSLEPWSRVLQGTSGSAPDPVYDPLAMAIDEANKRGLELHAWFNPFRAGANGNNPANYASNHIVNDPVLGLGGSASIVRRYGNLLILDPGHPDTHTYTLDVIKDVVRRYNVDGIHFDDYFYPSPESIDINSVSQTAGVATAVTAETHYLETGDEVTIAGVTPSGYNGTFTVTRVNATTFTYSVSNALAAGSGASMRFTRIFPDNATYLAYRTSGAESLADFRRRRVNEFVVAVRDAIRAESGKGHVRYGIAPIGIWRNNNPTGISGLRAYDDQFADTKLWINNAYVDYLLPQTYWKRQADGGNAAQDFDDLISWWGDQNTSSRHVYGGLSPMWITPDVVNYSASDVLNQVTSTRSQSAKGVVGNSWFRLEAFTDNSGAGRDNLSTTLTGSGGLYEKDALIPTSPWLPFGSPDTAAPAAPAVTFAGTAGSGPITAHWNAAGTEAASRWVVYYRVGAGTWNYSVVPAWRRSLLLPGTAASTPTEIAVSAVDRFGNQSTAAAVAVTAPPFAPTATPTWTSLENFESFAAAASVIFRLPNTSTNTGVSGTGLGSAVGTGDWNNRLDPRAGSTGTKQHRIAWTWTTPWSSSTDGSGSFRLTTGGTTNKPSPLVDTTQGLGFYVKLPYDLAPEARAGIDVSLLLRETGGSGPIGANGGTTGAIERTTTKVRLASTTDWQHVYFDLPNLAYTSFSSGNGRLDNQWMTLEALFVESAAGFTPSDVRIYLDDMYQGTTPQTPLGPPSLVTGLRAQGGDANVNLQWNASAEDDLSGYNVYRSTTSPVALTSANRIASVSASATSYLDLTAANGTAYFYAVSAFDAEGYEGEAIHTVSATPASSAATALAVTRIGSTTRVTFTGFTGAGFAAAPSAGQLSSGAFSAAGILAGPLAFGASRTTAEYARGTSTTVPASPGIFALDRSGNTALGLATGAEVLRDGALTLRLRNTTGSTMQGLVLGFDALSYNAGDRAQTLSAAISTNGTTWTAISGTSLTTPGTKDVSPAWSSVAQFGTATGLSVADNAVFYVRFSIAEEAGTASTTDAFALDNIALTPLAGGADADGDGVADAVEDVAGGDANADGVQDRNQAYVVRTTTPGSDVLTISVPDAQAIRSVVTQTAAAVSGTLSNGDFPQGLVSFNIEGVTPGGATTVFIEFPGATQGSGINRWFKWGPQVSGGPVGIWALPTSGPPTTAWASRNGLTTQWVLNLVDGAAGDSDFLANGTITDPGGPGPQNLSIEDWMLLDQ